MNEKYVLTLNGDYIGEYNRGAAYYLYLSQTDYGHRVRYGYSLFNGDVIKIWLEDNNGDRTLVREFVTNIDENVVEEVIIPNGQYKIATALNQNKAVDLSKAGDNNVHLWDYQYQLNALWIFEYDSSKRAHQIKNAWRPELVLA
ncbi:hypothetical protein U0X36_04895 [Bacillus thuringiensis]|uniref:hypothetical protein n=1 Tax=Bacillus thuringiensis TaxID=1428 RepID=UPI000E4C68D8|nr:hypothetical protein [Bacillus thuringiensis]MDZ3952290.1 hypothetical protein [Bacillus thuringiensis]RGP53428.1 hypothetical protein BTW32_09855 [Bacillus thuringiensis]